VGIGLEERGHLVGPARNAPISTTSPSSFGIPWGSIDAGASHSR
jgi:hypothetical protein